MATVYTIDTSVFISAYNTYEVAHADSKQLIDRVREDSLPVIEPLLLLPEAAAAIARIYRDAELARTFATSLHLLPQAIWVTVDERVARMAVDIAADHRLRGSDAVYVAVALRFGTTLVTLDREQYEQVSAVITTRYPAEIIAEVSAGDEDA